MKVRELIARKNLGTLCDKLTALEEENARLREALKSTRDRLVGVSWQGVPLPCRVLVTAVIAAVDRALTGQRSSTPSTEETIGSSRGGWSSGEKP